MKTFTLIISLFTFIGTTQSIAQNSNTFYGDDAGLSNTTGSSNTYIGHMAFASDSIGNGNTAVEAWSRLHVHGAGNSFFGELSEYYDGSSNSSYNNSFFGSNSGQSSSGRDNCFFGVLAGADKTLVTQILFTAKALVRQIVAIIILFLELIQGITPKDDPIVSLVPTQDTIILLPAITVFLAKLKDITIQQENSIVSSDSYQD